MFNKILDILSDDITLTITPEIVHLDSKGLKKSIRTIIYLSLDDKKPIIVGVGDELKSSAANREVHLFKVNTWDKTNPSKKELLCAFVNGRLKLSHFGS